MGLGGGSEEDKIGMVWEKEDWGFSLGECVGFFQLTMMLS